MPALLMRMSMRPHFSMALRTMSATPFSSVTLQGAAIASPPAALISATTLSAASDEPPEPSRAPPQSRGAAGHQCDHILNLHVSSLTRSLFR